MKNLTLENLTKVCGGVYSGPSDKLEQEVSSITTDSRKAEAGTFFVPIVGERVDAHKFIPQVMEAGALATLSERILEYLSELESITTTVSPVFSSPISFAASYPIADRRARYPVETLTVHIVL